MDLKEADQYWPQYQQQSQYWPSHSHWSYDRHRTTSPPRDRPLKAFSNTGWWSRAHTVTLLEPGLLRNCLLTNDQCYPSPSLRNFTTGRWRNFTSSPKTRELRLQKAARYSSSQCSRELAFFVTQISVSPRSSLSLRQTDLHWWSRYRRRTNVPNLPPKTLYEGIVRPADWSKKNNDMPTYGSYNLGALHPLSLTPGSWQIGDLLDRAQKRGKGQQENANHPALYWIHATCQIRGRRKRPSQLKAQKCGIVVTKEKYTVARSEHCTILALATVWDAPIEYESDPYTKETTEDLAQSLHGPSMLIRKVMMRNVPRDTVGATVTRRG